MQDEYIEKIRNTESVEAYEKAVSDLTDYLYKHGKVNESAELTEVALLKKNRFSKREMKAELLEKKAAVIKYCSMLTNELQRGNRDTILSIISPASAGKIIVWRKMLQRFRYRMNRRNRYR